MSSFPKNSIGISWEPFSHPSFEAIGIRGQHAFIIYTDENGINHVLEHGDPYYSYDNPNLLYDGSLKNYLRYRIGILDDTTPYPHPEGTREQINSDGIIFKSSASFPNWKASDNYFLLDIPVENQKLVWEEMKEHARAIKDSRTPYEFGLQGPVSNSVIASILADIGFSLEEITGVSIPSGLTLSDSASIGMAIAFGEVSMNDLGYGGISNTVSHVQSGNISGLTHAQIRTSNKTTDSDTTDQGIIESVSGRGKLKGTSTADAFTFTSFESFTKKSADKIIGFDSRQGDTIAVSSDAFPSLKGNSKIRFTVTNSKKKLKQLSKQGFDFLYFEKKGRLYFDGNGAGKNWGNPNEGGLVAILQGKPDLTASDFTLMG